MLFAHAGHRHETNPAIYFIPLIAVIIVAVAILYLAKKSDSKQKPNS